CRGIIQRAGSVPRSQGRLLPVRYVAHDLPDGVATGSRLPRSFGRFQSLNRHQEGWLPSLLFERVLEVIQHQFLQRQRSHLILALLREESRPSHCCTPRRSPNSDRCIGLTTQLKWWPSEGASVSSALAETDPAASSSGVRSPLAG